MGKWVGNCIWYNSRMKSASKIHSVLKFALLSALAVVVGIPLLMTVWCYIGGIETGDMSLPDDADLLWTAPAVADEDKDIKGSDPPVYALLYMLGGMRRM